MLKFFGLTYALSWVLWAPVALVPPGLPFRSALFLPGIFAPAIVALWLTPARRELIDRVLKWQVPPRWYLLAIGYMAGIKLAAAVLYRFFFGAWPAFEPGPWVLFVGAMITSTPFQSGEEIGWRGYALPRLTARFGLGAASIILGVIWAAWHLPLFFIAGTDKTGGSFPFYLMTVIPISVAIAWVYARTGGSLLLTMLMHAAANNTPRFMPPAASGNVWALNAPTIQAITAALMWAGAAYFLVRMRARPVHLGP